jgi:hypothetical protein
MDPLTIAVGLAVWLAFRKHGESQFGVLTPEREEVYNNALEHLQDPLRLAELAREFQTTGLKIQAAMLRKRAEWRARSEPIKQKHEAIFEKAMQSQNIQAILAVAQAFEDMTATAKALRLREHVRVLQQEMQKHIAKAAQEAKGSTNGAGKKVDIPKNTSTGESAEVEE